MKHEYEVICGNIGTVHTGAAIRAAEIHFDEYVAQSKSEYGRAAGESVTLMRDGEIHREYIGTLERSEDEDDTPARIRCDQCEALMIQGIFCHEPGCPNSSARYDAESGEWIRQRKCFDCGCTVDIDEPCCTYLDDYDACDAYDGDNL